MKTMCSVLMGVMLAMLQVGCNTLADGLGPRLGKPAAAEWANSLKPRGEAAQELTLAAEGETDYVIVIPAKPTTQEQKAADELTQWLKEMTVDAVFPTVSDATPRRATEISVGRTNRLAIVDIPAAKEDLGDEGYAIAVQGKRLFLFGGRKRGPIYAAFALLEEDLGCRWYTSARAPTVGVISRIPSRPTLKFRPVPRSYVPPLVVRNPFYMEAFEGTWSLRNRTNAHWAPVDEKWGGHFDYALQAHTFNRLVPKSLFKEHPDYFMLNDDGKRIPKQLCLSNPEVAKIATRKVLEVLKSRPNSEIISVSANDGTGRCHCRNCKALDKAGDPGMDVRAAFTSYTWQRFGYSSAGSLLHFVNQIAEAVQKEHPKVLVSTLAYNESQRAPVKSQCRDNVAIRLCNHCQILNWPVDFTTSKNKDAKDYREQVLKWSKITKNLHIWEYTGNFSNILVPTPNMDVIATAIRYYVDHGVKGVMLQGNHGWTQNAERALMRVWVMSKLLWDPSRDVVALQNDFIRGFYGKAAPAIEAYYDILADLAAGRIAKKDDPGTGVPGLDTMPAPAAQVFLKNATAIFDRAERLADNQQILNRVKLERSAIMYVKLQRGPEFVIQLGEDYPSLIDRFEKIARREKMGRLTYRYGLDHMLDYWRNKALVDPEQISASSLGNVWKFKADVDKVGQKEKWYTTELDDTGWADARSDTGRGWESQGFPNHIGYGWYRQRVKVPEGSDSKKFFWLLFGAVDEDAVVYINGKKVFEHTCESTGLTPAEIWDTPFVLKARRYLRLGEDNLLVVRVYNRGDMGGIWKPVYLVASDTEVNAQALLDVVQEKEKR